MFNAIGKTLVLANLTAAIMGMTWAAAIFTQRVDFGWKEPRKEMDKRVPSEFDKRAAALAESYRVIGAMQPWLKPAQDDLRAAEDRFGPNHLFYREQLARLRRGDPGKGDKLIVKQLKEQNNTVELDVPVIGRPVFGALVPKVQKPYQAYVADLKKLRGDVVVLEKEIDGLRQQATDLTLKITGKDEKGKSVPGLNALIELEKKRLRGAEAEIEYIRPHVAETRDDAAGFGERRAQLEATLKALKGKK